MEHEMMTHEDYARYDRVWQRVAPELDPYPEVRAAMAPAVPECCSVQRGREEGALLGSLIDHELADRCAYLAAVRCAPNPSAAQVLRRIADEEGAHARRLMGL